MPIATDDNEPRRNSSAITLGQDLSSWSLQELEQRINALDAEIARTKKEIAAKTTHLAAADSVFGRR